VIPLALPSNASSAKAASFIDLMVSSQTGSGKTAAFLLPILQQLAAENKNKPGTRVLVLSPTRELANQTEAACKQFAPKGITCCAIIGGAGYKRQIEDLRLNDVIAQGVRTALCHRIIKFRLLIFFGYSVLIGFI
jgi:superfamily II DNA/RNA helicase